MYSRAVYTYVYINYVGVCTYTGNCFNHCVHGPATGLLVRLTKCR